MPETTLYGFDGSTYVRTAKIVLNRKDVSYDQVPVNVLEGEPRQPEHLARHPFGKVPVLDIDGRRIRETDAICRYVEATRDGPSALPESAADRARMDETMALVHGYGYDALIGAAGYHLFPDFLGNPTEADHQTALDASATFLGLVAELKGGDDWIAGAAPSLADYYVGPLVFYALLSPHGAPLLKDAGLTEWWERLSGDPDFAATEPDLG